jgi:hypothetical protein
LESTHGGDVLATTHGTPHPPVGALLEVGLTARNLSRYAANKIHDDVVARAYGYQGGLVAGTTLYAYMTRPLVAAWGSDWLAQGTARLTLRRPVYDGDELTVTPDVVGRSGGDMAGELVVRVRARARGAEVAELTAGISWGALPLVPDPTRYPAAPLPEERLPAEPAALARLDPLGSPALDADPATALAYAREVEDPLPLYAGVEPIVHPGLVLQQANRALSENVALGPWIHAASNVAHCGLARAGARLETRGRVARLSERKGHRFVELDLLVVADGSRPVAHIHHTAIYVLRGPTESQP